MSFTLSNPTDVRPHSRKLGNSSTFELILHFPIRTTWHRSRNYGYVSCLRLSRQPSIRPSSMRMESRDMKNASALFEISSGNCQRRLFTYSIDYANICIWSLNMNWKIRCMPRIWRLCLHRLSFDRLTEVTVMPY